MGEPKLIKLREWVKLNKELSKNIFSPKDVDIMHTKEADFYLLEQENFIKIPIEEIYNLKKLEKLLFRFNELDKLSDNIKKLTNLKVLWIEESAHYLKINDLPQGLYSLKELTKLSIVNFGIEYISEDISKLNLTSLELWGNNLTELPESIVKLNLDYLDLGANHNLILTKEQKIWIQKLDKNGCTIKIDIDY